MGRAAFYYKLAEDGVSYVQAHDSVEWERCIEDVAARTVGRTVILFGFGRSKQRIIISTIFTGLDVAFGDGPPLVFETAVLLAGGGDSRRMLSSTWSGAVETHWRAVKDLEDDLKENRIPHIVSEELPVVDKTREKQAETKTIGLPLDSIRKDLERRIR